MMSKQTETMPKKPGDPVNPNSLANLDLGRGPGHGRTSEYEEPKKRHGVTITEQGWKGLEALAAKEGVSVSELLERIGRGLLPVMDAEQLEALEERLDLEECERRLADPTEVPVPYEQAREALGLS